MLDFARAIGEQSHLTLSGVPEGLDALVLADLARAHFKAHEGAALLHIARDDARAETLMDALAFFASDVDVMKMPAWDCLPYDRVSPKSEISAERMACLARLTRRQADPSKPAIIIATVNASLQRVPTRALVAASHFSAHVGNSIELDALTGFLDRNGYARASSVMEPGDYAVRGGIVDIFPPGEADPLRLDFFGDTLDSVRTFDPDSQRSKTQKSEITLVPVSEFFLDEASIRRFRQGYVERFGAATGDDPLYESVSAGRRYEGMEHWLPLFHESLETLFDFAPGALVSFDPLAADAREDRLEQIADYYDARAEAPDVVSSGSFAAPTYKPLKPEELYILEEEWKELLTGKVVRELTVLSTPESATSIDLKGRLGRKFTAERNQDGVNVFEALKKHIDILQRKGGRVLVAAWTQGSRERLSHVLEEHGISNIRLADNWTEVQSAPPGAVCLIILGLETGFVTNQLAVIGEQDILGDRLTRGRRARRAANFLKEATSLTQGDLVVHIDHGIGRYEGLQTLEVMGAPHDCLLIVYAGGDKLYLPVENIELLSRYGSDQETAQLDRLGGSGWQARKAKLKDRIRDIANQLIKVAAERELKEADRLIPPEGMYDEFCARFPYDETEDQINAIEDVVDDLGKGRPMDRLVCGDVGFGKTEVALRAAFIGAMAGDQVAIICPTTLLARQHFKTFKERFAGWPLRVEQLSRFVSAKEATETRKGLTEGQVDVVIGTHALLAKTIKFKRLGLLIVDEEQHFGVNHKERLKQLRSDVHVLTLTATPIPRTLQLALSGVREMSIIATPPVDRLAVRTYVSPFDPVVVREALLREHYRGGQCFYVCPRISDLSEAEEFIKEYVPEVRAVVAHGQMPTSELEDIMTDFYDGKFDVLISTTIVESGLDIPTANTLVVHRADMFGLSQLYQIRGRIGRSKRRAYAYLTYRPKKPLTPNAERRLQVLQSLDSLGAGFNLASHDLDIRGAGNLLGEEQSGHVREVGFELYQDMLEEAVASLRSGEQVVETDGHWSPQINIGTAVLIPESYVADLNVRLALYRRLSELTTREEIDGIAAEMIDRFGKLPEEVEQLLKIMTIKGFCRTAAVEKIDAGPKGAIVTFRNSQFPNPEGLIDFLSRQQARVKIRPDHKLVYSDVWESPSERLDGCTALVRKLAEIAR
ncbi:MAG: transcription-repair coupling factor [Alphaproteobacteria bacterium]|nr:MAG: transcription-repair coupling factor [Alphaproteobacteria bacterium]